MANFPFLNFGQTININSDNTLDFKEANNKALLSLLDNLSNGETLSGKIISFNENSYTFKTEQDITIHAKTEKGISLTKGSTVMFEVTKNNDNTVKLRPLYTNTSMKDTANVALRQAGIPQNDKAIEYTVRRMELGFNIDRKSLSEGYKDVALNEEFPVKYIVDLQKMDIPRTVDNLKAYEAFSNMENALSDSFSEISKTLSNEIVSAFIDEIGNAVSENQAQTLPVTVSENEGVILELNTAPENVSIEADNDTQNSGISEKNRAVLDFFNGLNELFSSDEELDTLDIITAVKNQVKEFDASLSQTENNIKNPADIVSSISSEMLDEIHNADASGDRFLNLIKDILGNKESLDAPLENDEAGTANLELRQILEPKVTDAITKIFERNWSISKEKISDKKEIKDLYERMYSDSKKLAHVLEENLPKDSKAVTLVQNLNKNLDFFDALNHYVPYVQIPFKGENGVKNGELYVFKNKKNFTESSGELTAFVHLDTDYLGPTDISIKLNGDRVNTLFYLADEESLDFIEKNLDYLNNRLSVKGYSFTGSASLNKDKKSPIEIMHENQTNKIVFAKNTFDARV